MLADRRPALLWPLPNVSADISLRTRLGGRPDAGAVPFAAGGIDGWRTTEGARLAEMDGDGEERDGATPLVWIPGGMGRLILVATGAADAMPTAGAMVGVGCRPRSFLVLQTQIAPGAWCLASMGR